jgi:hypothetical protein
MCGRAGLHRRFPRSCRAPLPLPGQLRLPTTMRRTGASSAARLPDQGGHQVHRPVRPVEEPSLARRALHDEAGGLVAGDRRHVRGGDDQLETVEPAGARCRPAATGRTVRDPDGAAQGRRSAAQRGQSGSLRPGPARRRRPAGRRPGGRQGSSAPGQPQRERQGQTRPPGRRRCAPPTRTASLAPAPNSRSGRPSNARSGPAQGAAVRRSSGLRGALAGRLFGLPVTMRRGASARLHRGEKTCSG